MSVTSYVLGIVAAVLVLVVVIDLLRRKRLRERHAIWWLVTGTVALLLAVFPSVLNWLAALVGITLPVNLLFFGSIAILFLVALQASSELTKLEDQTRLLAEELAILKLDVERLKSHDKCAHSDPTP